MTDNFITRYNISILIPPEGVCPGDVEWIVSTGDEGKAFADFAPVRFYNSTATQKDGTVINIHDAELVWVKDREGNIMCASQKADDPRYVGMTRQN